MIKNKTRPRKIWQRFRFQDDTVRLNRMTHKLNLEIKKYMNSRFNNYWQTLNREKTSDYSLWKSTKNLNRPRTHIPPIHMAEGNRARTNSQKSELFANYIADGLFLS